jgi:hypothetical protein
MYSLEFESQDFCIETSQEVTIDMENSDTAQTISFGTFDLADQVTFFKKNFPPDKEHRHFNYFKRDEIDVLNKGCLWRFDPPAMSFSQSLAGKKKFPQVGFCNSFSYDDLPVVKLFILKLEEQQNARAEIDILEGNLLLSVCLNALKIKLATGAHKDIILTLKNSERYQISNANVRRIDDLSNPIIKNEFDMFKKELYPL